MRRKGQDGTRRPFDELGGLTLAAAGHEPSYGFDREESRARTDALRTRILAQDGLLGLGRSARRGGRDAIVTDAFLQGSDADPDLGRPVNGRLEAPRNERLFGDDPAAAAARIGRETRFRASQDVRHVRLGPFRRPTACRGRLSGVLQALPPFRDLEAA